MSNWIQNAKGNHIRRDYGDNIIATVFMTRSKCWAIVDNREGYGKFVEGEFGTPMEAIKRADNIIDKRAKCRYVPRTAKSANSSPWVKQKVRHNDAETYGRTKNHTCVSVKRAASEKWFYIIHGSSNGPVGWFDTPEQAMTAFDLAY